MDNSVAIDKQMRRQQALYVALNNVLPVALCVALNVTIRVALNVALNVALRVTNFVCFLSRFLGAIADRRQLT